MSSCAIPGQLPGIRVKDCNGEPRSGNAERQGSHYPWAGHYRWVPITTRTKTQLSPRCKGEYTFRQYDDELLLPTFQGSRWNRGYWDTNARRQLTGKWYCPTDKVEVNATLPKDRGTTYFGKEV